MERDRFSASAGGGHRGIERERESGSGGGYRGMDRERECGSGGGGYRAMDRERESGSAGGVYRDVPSASGVARPQSNDSSEFSTLYQVCLMIWHLKILVSFTVDRSA